VGELRQLGVGLDLLDGRAAPFEQLLGADSQEALASVRDVLLADGN
jgi:hypothetical protein